MCGSDTPPLEKTASEILSVGAEDDGALATMPPTATPPVRRNFISGCETPKKFFPFRIVTQQRRARIKKKTLGRAPAIARFESACAFRLGNSSSSPSSLGERNKNLADERSRVVSSRVALSERRKNPSHRPPLRTVQMLAWAPTGTSQVTRVASALPSSRNAAKVVGSGSYS